MKNYLVKAFIVVMFLLINTTTSALKIHNTQQFITADLKEIIAAGPELGAMEKKLNHYEAIKPVIQETKSDVRELLSPIVPLAPRHVV